MSDRNPSRRLTRRNLFQLAAVAVVGQAGCNYSLRSLYDSSFTTVYVPEFQADPIHRELGPKLTEFLTKEIKKRTPYKVVHNREKGDMILEGSVNYVNTASHAESPQSPPQPLTVAIQVSVNWMHNPPLDSEKNRQPVLIAEAVNFTPELGKTSTSAVDKTCQTLATKLVDLMEGNSTSNPN
ncbi:LPS assembly lipoprotein LptE [Singulisphaera rosea]